MLRKLISARSRDALDHSPLVEEALKDGWIISGLPYFDTYEFNQDYRDPYKNTTLELWYLPMHKAAEEIPQFKGTREALNNLKL
jgi:hypothetical protein